MKNTLSFIKDGKWFTMTLAVIVSVFLMVAIAQASTTISTDIATDGALTVSGATSLQGATSTSLAVTGSTTISTVLNLGGALNANGNITVNNGGATSSVTVGCVVTNATSSATKVKLLFNVEATSTTLNGATVRGLVLWTYGSDCSS